MLGSWRESALILSAPSAGEMVGRASGRRVSGPRRGGLFFSKPRKARNEAPKGTKRSREALRASKDLQPRGTDVHGYGREGGAL